MFFDTFSELCEKKGISCKRAAIEIGLSHAAPPKWKASGATPRGDTLKKIADYFGVSVSYLVGEEQKETPTAAAMSEDELDAFVRGLSQEERKRLLALGKAAFGK